MAVMPLLSGTCLLVLLLAAGGAEGHGVVVDPPSRVKMCGARGGNRNCYGGCPSCIQGPSRYPEGGARDGELASYGNQLHLDGPNQDRDYSALDEQTATRWAKNRVRSGGRQGFTWNFPAAHKTRDFRYFITKATWNPNAPLTRAQFEPTPFCRIVMGTREPFPQPARETTHQCNLPTRNGYHVVLAIWHVAQAGSRSFNQVIDLDFGGAAAPTPGNNGNNNGRGPAPRPQPRPTPQQRCPAYHQGRGLCKGREGCCTNGDKCFAYNSATSVCLFTCPDGWDCSKGSNCQKASGWLLCKGNKGCCPRGTKCHAYNNQYSMCMASCPQGWACRN